MQKAFEIESAFSEMNLKAFETGKRFNVKENERFCKMALKAFKLKLIEKGLKNEQG